MLFTGYKQSPPDPRDYTQDNTPDNFKYIWKVLDQIKTPERFGLWDKWPRIEDQGELGSCVAQGTTSIIEYNDKEPDDEYVELSRLGLYHDCLAWDGKEITGDIGTDPRTAIMVAHKIGVGAEKLCPYDITKYKEMPPEEYYADAARRKIRAFFRIEKLRHIIASIAIRKPVIIGIPVYDSFFWDDTVKTGIVPYPSWIQLWRGPRGYHLVTAGDFDNNTEYMGFANSYGLKWGNKGRFWLSYKYIENMVIKRGLIDNWFILK